jgi:hypothetical protein
MIAWGTPNGLPLLPADHEAMEAALAGHDWTRVFAGAGVLALKTESERLEVREKLTAVSRDQLGNRVHILISPVMQSGTGVYTGYVASTLWEQLNKLVV